MLYISQRLFCAFGCDPTWIANHHLSGVRGKKNLERLCQQDLPGIQIFCAHLAGTAFAWEHFAQTSNLSLTSHEPCSSPGHLRCSTDVSLFPCSLSFQSRADETQQAKSRAGHLSKQAELAPPGHSTQPVCFGVGIWCW